MRMHPITVENASVFTIKPLENFKLFVPAVGQRYNTPPIVWVTGNHSKHILPVNRATHAHKIAQEVPAVCPRCCRASPFAPLARRILVSEPLDEVEVSFGGRKLHDILLALSRDKFWSPIPGFCCLSRLPARSTSCFPEKPLQVVSRDGEPSLADGWARQSVSESKQRKIRGRRGYLPSCIVGENTISPSIDVMYE